MFNIFKNPLFIHIAVEGIIILGLIYYFNRQLNQHEEKMKMLENRLRSYNVQRPFSKPSQCNLIPQKVETIFKKEEESSGDELDDELENELQELSKCE